MFILIIILFFLENSISNYYSTINKQLLTIYDNNWNTFIINNNKIHKDLNYFEIFNKEYLINKQNEFILLYYKKIKENNINEINLNSNWVTILSMELSYYK